MSICKINDLDTDLTHVTTIYSKWIIELNAKCKTIKLVEKNLCEFGFDDAYKIQYQKCNPQKKQKIGKLEFIKMKYFCFAKYTVNRIKYNEQSGWYHLQNTSDKGPYPENKNNL